VLSCERPLARRLNKVVGLGRRAGETAGKAPQPRQNRDQLIAEALAHRIAAISRTNRRFCLFPTERQRASWCFIPVIGRPATGDFAAFASIVPAARLYLLMQGIRETGRPHAHPNSSTGLGPGQIPARFGRAAWLFTKHSLDGIVPARQRQRYGIASTHTIGSASRLVVMPPGVTGESAA
jgi:hypothetical protein